MQLTFGGLSHSSLHLLMFSDISSHSLLRLCSVLKHFPEARTQEYTTNVMYIQLAPPHTVFRMTQISIYALSLDLPADSNRLSLRLCHISSFCNSTQLFVIFLFAYFPCLLARSLLALRAQCGPCDGYFNIFQFVGLFNLRVARRMLLRGDVRVRCALKAMRQKAGQFSDVR